MNFLNTLDTKAFQVFVEVLFFRKDNVNLTVFGHKQGDAFKKIKIINKQVTEEIEKISYIQVSVKIG